MSDKTTNSQKMTEHTNKQNTQQHISHKGLPSKQLANIHSQLTPTPAIPFQHDTTTCHMTVTAPSAHLGELLQPRAGVARGCDDDLGVVHARPAVLVVHVRGGGAALLGAGVGGQPRPGVVPLALLVQTQTLIAQVGLQRPVLCRSQRRGSGRKTEVRSVKRGQTGQTGGQRGETKSDQTGSGNWTHFKSAMVSWEVREAR